MPVQDNTEPKKQTNKERLKEITDSIEEGIKELFDSDKYKQYLTTMSRFHHYSVNNQMLIYMQMPNATHVAGFNKWRDQFERNVMKGQRGIKIIAPTPFKKKVEQEKLDPDTKLPILDPDGKVIIEEKEISIPMFKPVTVFDVSQTEGKPLPQLASDLHGNVQNYEVFMEALKRSAPVPITIEPMAGNMDGFYDTERKSIHVREGMSEIQTVSATLHEIAHSKLHDYKKNELLESRDDYDDMEICGVDALFTNGRVDRDKLPEGLYCYDLRGSDDDPGELRYLEERVVVNHAGSVITAQPIELPESGRLDVYDDMGFRGGSMTLRQFYEDAYPEKARKSRNTEEVEAESVSFAVCAYYGIATGENSFGYIASWSKDKELKELKASLETINKASSELITDIDRNYAAIMKERGIDEQTAEKDGSAAPAATVAEPSAEPEIRLDTPETHYPMPDPLVSVAAMQHFGYTDESMLPLSKDRALELMERDVTVYLLYADSTEAMALDTKEVIQHDGLFGIAREDWDAIKADIPPRDIEKRFQENPEDGILIYQLNDTAPVEIRFASFDELKNAPSADHYSAIYTQPLYDGGSKGEVLEQTFEQFNLQRPADFYGHSLSVSDIIAIKRGPEVTYHYCDSFGFKQLEGFQRSNYLKNAEMAMEDDFGMIDGIINNGPKQTEQEKKPSILEKLRQPVAERTPKTTAHKSAEMEI